MKFVLPEGVVGESPLCLSFYTVSLSKRCAHVLTEMCMLAIRACVAWLKATRIQTDLHC